MAFFNKVSSVLQEGWNSKLLMLFITITSLFARIFVLLQNMKIEDVYKKEINDLISRRGSTKFHITGIRHCDFKDKADDFIRDAAQKMQNVILMPEEANQYDHASVVCRSGNRKIGYVSVYDLEKYQILAGKEDSDHLTGHFFFGNTGDHLLDLSVAGIVTLDDIRDYRKEVDRQKKEQYSSWKHDAIKRFLVHGRHQEDAKACIIQMKEFVISLFGGYGSTTQEELSPKLEQYKESSQYDISLEGQRDRWDILRYLDYLYDRWHQPGAIVDEDFEDILTDVSSQIGGELGRNVSYTAYIERLTELVTKELPSSETAQYYLRTLPSEAFEDIRQQVENFPHHLYHLFHTNPQEFVRTLYYARIPRKYLDPFLSGIALVVAYDKNKGATERTDITRGSTKAGEEELNYEAPKINLQHLLRQPWFSDARSDEKYTAEWTDAFVEALMGSEFGEGIAHDWAVKGAREKKAQVRGYVVGLLKDAGVVKGSYGSIARKVGIIVNEENKKDPYKTFADYMARGKKQPYTEWVKEYVEGKD